MARQSLLAPPPSRLVSLKTLVLANLAAGNGRTKRILPNVRAFLNDQGIRADYVTPANADEIRRTAREAALSGYRGLVVLGGDGTLQQVAAGVLGTEVILGVVPCGSGNDMAEALGIPRDPIDAAEAMLRAAPRPVDILRAQCAGGHGGVYVGGGGLGIDTESLEFADGIFRGLPGSARYIAGALRALLRFKALAAEVEQEGKRVVRRERVMLAAVTNTPSYGAGLRIAPEAKIDDGQLDVVLLDDLPWTRLVEVIPLLLESGAVRLPGIWRFRGTRVVLRTDLPARFHGDGEILGETPVEIEVLPGAIRVAAPPPV